MIITVPAASVDLILKVLLALRLVECIAFEQHHGYAARQTPRVFRSLRIPVSEMAVVSIRAQQLVRIRKADRANLHGRGMMNAAKTVVSPRLGMVEAAVDANKRPGDKSNVRNCRDS